jgi:hypothetical protein
VVFGGLGFGVSAAFGGVPETPEKVEVMGVTATTVLVSGVLNPKAVGEEGVWFFLYGVAAPSECGSEELAPVPFGEAAGKKKEVVMEVLAGLQPDAKYTVCLIERNKANEMESAESVPVAFETLPLPPEVVGEAVSNVKAEEATLEAKVNPNNQETTFTFEYSTSEAEVLAGKGTPVAGTLAAGFDAEGDPVSAAVEPLAQGTTYFFRVVAENATGEKATPGAIEHFTTTIHPETPVGLEANPVGSMTATLSGVLNPAAQGDHGTYEFFYQQSETECQGGPGQKTVSGAAAGGVAEQVQAKITELLPHKPYTFCLRARNEAGEESALAGPVTFTTIAASPAVEEQFTTDVKATSATLHATLNPEGAETSYVFEYAKAGGSFAPVIEPEGHGQGSIAEGTSGMPLEVHIQQGLQPGTSYQLRLTAHNSVQTVTGEPVSFTTQQAGGVFRLPDGREYEMATPPDKHGALITNPYEGQRYVQAAANGSSVAYMASAPIESEPQGNTDGEVPAVSLREPEGWTSRNVAIPNGLAPGYPLGGLGQEYRVFSTDLTHAVVQPFGSFLACRSADGAPAPCVSLEASEQTAFLASLPCIGCPTENGPATYTPLATGCPSHAEEQAGHLCEPDVSENADVPAGTVFGLSFGERNTCPKELICGPMFRGATPDLSHIVIQSRVPLAGEAIATVRTNEGGDLYEYSGGRLVLVSVLPDGEPASVEHALIGLGEGPDTSIEAGSSVHGVSEDGSRVVFFVPHHLYLRVNALQPPSAVSGAAVNGEQCVEPLKACTIELDEGLTGTGEFPSKEFPRFRTANGELSEVLFTYSGVLYRYDVQTRSREVLAEGVQSVVRGPGEGEDGGSYLYFIADGVAENAGVPVPGAVPGTCQLTPEDIAEDPESGVCNLYVRHDGVTGLVAVVPDGGTSNMRVSPDGEWLAFVSTRGLTGYDNRDVAGGGRDGEVYVFDAVSGSLSCVSCDPTGARPSGGASVSSWLIYDFSESAVYQPRFLTDEGRLFFDTSEALVPLDGNGVQDVYEYEPLGVPVGEHACSSSSGSGSEVFKAAHPFDVEEEGLEERGVEGAGCVALISSGTSSEQSIFLDASESGGDVFFLTTAKLSAQDFDTADDIYDAHECTSGSPCIPVGAERPPPCDTEASCKASPAPQPSIYGVGPSETFTGPGSPVEPAPSLPAPAAKKVVKKVVKCKKGFAKNKKGKCVRRKKKTGSGKARKARDGRRASR